MIGATATFLAMLVAEEYMLIEIVDHVRFSKVSNRNSRQVMSGAQGPKNVGPNDHDKLTCGDSESSES